jgi:S-adenosylmethionine-diacylglycerol 3-amino-3-carboxypropyl transferase
MMHNPIQFAVVREDPELPIRALKTLCEAPSRALLIVSGGRIALAIASQLPNLQLTLIDKNPEQLDLVKLKFDKIRCQSPDEFKSLFNIGSSNKTGLNECGNFETLFRSLRNFIHDMIMPYDQLCETFGTNTEREI